MRKFADRVLLLDDGRPVALGEPEPVIEEYERRNREREASREPAPGSTDGHAEVVGAWLESEQGEPLSVVRQNEEASFRFAIRLQARRRAAGDGVRPARRAGAGS